MCSGWRRVALVLLALLFLFPSTYLFWHARFGYHLGYLQDDELYLTTAASLAKGTGYRIVSLPGAPYQTKYPPLYPLLLAGIWRLNPNFPANLAWAVGLSWLNWLSYLASAAILFRRFFQRTTFCWLALALLATHAACIFYAVQIMAESLFAALILCAILLATKSSQAQHGRMLAIAAGLVGGLGFLVKTAALPVLITMPLVFMRKRQYARAVLSSLVATPFVAGWLIWSASHRLPTSDPVLLYYTDYVGFYKATIHWSDFLRLLNLNFAALLQTIASTVTGIPGVSVPVAAVLGTICIVGSARLLRAADLPHLSAFASVYTAQLLIWNFPPHERFLFPLTPLLIAAALNESRYFWRHISSLASQPVWRKKPQIGGAAALAACFLILVVWQCSIACNIVTAQLDTGHQSLLAKQRAYSCLSRHLAPSDILVAYDDPAAYLYTGHQALRNQVMLRPYLTGDTRRFGEPVSQIAEFARRHQAAYLLWAPDDYAIDRFLSDQRFRETLLQQNRGLDMVYSQDGVRIYSVLGRN